MIDPWKIINELESNNSRLFKEDVIEKNLSYKNFQEGLAMCLDPLVTFGVKQVPESEKNGVGLAWIDFKKGANLLIEREKTGHAARDLIIELMNSSTNSQWNDWYRRILIKDLRCGVSEKTVNNVAKRMDLKFRVPVFSCMLAHDGAKHPKKIKGNCLVEYKYDGVRVIAIVMKGKATLYSRNGKIFHNFHHIEKALSKPEYNDIVFDGEVMSDDFQALMKQVYRKSGAKTDDAYLALFDILPLSEFNQGKSKLTSIERKKELKKLSKTFENVIKLVDYEIINFDDKDGQDKFSIMNKEALKKGFEGLMIKPNDNYYESKRSHAWLKIKPFIEVTLKIIDIQEGTGKHAGKLGAFNVEGSDDGKFFSLSVGSGLTDDEREKYWASKDKLLGRLIEIRADAITQSIEGENFSLRFPRFKSFRGFEKNEKI
ncbi:MAG: RNA ligase family protein [Gammaproteobacteria bacterium]|tara:strand:+ start:705 stop:1991 length:1287 start_codon:yes stop_codon:yes gene_type:complete